MTRVRTSFADAGLRALRLVAAGCFLGAIALSSQASAIDASIALDSRLLPAIERLREISSATVAGALPASARKTVADVCERWREQRQALQTALAADPKVTRTIARVGRHLGSACSHAESGRGADALRLLEMVRDDLAASRERAGLHYFLDRVLDYEQARVTLLRAHAVEASAGRGLDRTEQAFAESMARWREVERMLPELNKYPLREGSLARLQEAVARHNQALSRISVAIDTHGANPAAFAEAVSALQRPFDDLPGQFSTTQRRSRERGKPGAQ